MSPFLWWKIHSTPFSRAWITADLLGFAVLALACTKAGHD